MLITEVRKAVETYPWQGVNDAHVRRWVEGTPWVTLKAEIAEPSDRALALWDAAPELFGMLEGFAAMDAYLEEVEAGESEWTLGQVTAVTIVGFFVVLLVLLVAGLFV